MEVCSDDVQIGFSYIFMGDSSSALITAYLHEKQYNKWQCNKWLQQMKWAIVQFSGSFQWNNEKCWHHVAWLVVIVYKYIWPYSKYESIL